MATKGSVGKSLGQRHAASTGGAGSDKTAASAGEGQQGKVGQGGGRGGRFMGDQHRESSGAGNVGAKPQASATGHAGHMKGRGSEKVTEHHRK